MACLLYSAGSCLVDAVHAMLDHPQDPMVPLPTQDVPHCEGGASCCLATRHGHIGQAVGGQTCGFILFRLGEKGLTTSVVHCMIFR